MSFKTKTFALTLLVMLAGVMVLGSAVMAADSEQQAEYAPPIMVVNTSFLNVRTGPGAYYSILTTVVGGTELPVLGVYRDQVWYQVSTLLGVGWINSEHAVGRGDFSHVPLAEAPEITNTYGDTDTEDPGTGGGGEATTTMPSGNHLWGVSIAETHAAVMGNLDSGWTVELRANPDVVYPILDTGGLNGVLFYLVHDDWAGDVWLNSIHSAPRPYACDSYAISFPSDVNLSVGPDGSGSEGFLPAYTEGYLIGRQADNFFFVEMMDGTAGWTYADPLTIMVREPGAFPELCTGVSTTGGNTGSTTGSTETTTTTTQPAIWSSARVVINTGHLNIRSGPGAQYTVIATVAGGTELPVTGFAPDGVWYRVAGDFGQGWLNSEYTLFRGDGRNIPIIRGVTGVLANPKATITNAVTLYAAPNATMGVIGTLSGPLEVDVVARTAAFDWVQLSTSLGYGWVSADAIQLSGDTTSIPVVGN